MANFNPEHKQVLDAMLLVNPKVRAGKMFGYPAYYTGKKMAVCLYEQGVGIKLPAPTVEKLLQTNPNTIPFQPLGKPKMRGWVQVNLDRSEDYRQYAAVFEESIQYVSSIQDSG